MGLGLDAAPTLPLTNTSQPIPKATASQHFPGRKHISYGFNIDLKNFFPPLPMAKDSSASSAMVEPFHKGPFLNHDATVLNEAMVLPWIYTL